MAANTSNTVVKGLEDLSIIKELSSSTRIKSFLAVDQHGKHFHLTYLDRERYLARFEMNLFKENDGMGASEVKKLALEQYKDVVDDFKTVAERTMGLSHPNIAELYRLVYDKANDRYVTVSEYVHGNSIFQDTQGFLPIQTICLFVQALDALKFIHSNGMLHLNIKSKNVYVTMEGAGFVTKLLGYGFAIPKDDYKGDFRGTALYMAPEVAFGWNDKIDERADLYSLAALMYYCLARRLPMEHRARTDMTQKAIAGAIEKEGMLAPIHHFNREVPEALEKIVMTLLAKDPDKRGGFNSATSVLDYFYENWPEASRVMPIERTITVHEHKSLRDEPSATVAEDVEREEDTVVKKRKKK